MTEMKSLTLNGKKYDSFVDRVAREQSGTPGDNGATFTPSVDADGTLSWTNDKGLVNPNPVNIKGQTGGSGEDGFSPIATVEQTSDGARISITDKNGTTTAVVRNGTTGSGEGGGPVDAVRYGEQTLNDAEQAQARTNIGAVSIAEVEELLNGDAEEEFSETGDPLVLDLKEDTEIEVASKISRQASSNRYDSTKLILHHTNTEAIIDVAGMFGGPGAVIEKNGLTMTINDDGTATIKGTSTDKTLFDGTIPSPRVVYPAGDYFIHSSAEMMQPTDIDNINLGNKWGGRTYTIDKAFVLSRIRIEYGSGKTVDETIPINISLANVATENDYPRIETEYVVDFGQAVTEGEYNWTTGELKDANGNTVAFYDKQQIIGTAGMNVLWTGFGEITASNKSENDLEKVVIRFGESAPEETVSSICDFTLTPTTPQAEYCLHHEKVRNGGVFNKHEIPLITTKGTLSVVNLDGEVITEKYVDALINWQGVTDLLTNKGIHKAWSGKFYITKAPVAQEDFTDINNALYTFEFTEEDFQNTGLPAKLDNIPIVSPCFYAGADAASKLNARVWGGEQFPATLSWDASSSKYIFKVRGTYPGNIMNQLTAYSKGYFHYQLETAYNEPATFAMGISSGDTVTFTVDDSDWKTYLDAGLYRASTSITEADATPTGFVYIPRNAEDACDGMLNTARMLNNAGSAGGDATVQGYSWIGAGDGSTDYTSKIQSKLDVLHSISDGGTIYLGPGTYPISGSLLVYDDTRIIGDGRTIIEQTADNTHALVLCGSDITIEDLSIKLSGECTAVTACVYANSNNRSSEADYNSNFPETRYVQRLTLDNVFMSGEYAFGSENGYPVVSDMYDNYKGVGIYSNRLFFNYAHVDNVHFKHLHAGVYGGGGSNYFNVTSEFNKYGLYINRGGDNTYFVNGHSYYTTDADGNYITMSEAIAYSEADNMSTYHLRTYDTQAYKMIAFFGEKTSDNKIDVQYVMSTQHGQLFSHSWNILKWLIVDYGRANVYSDWFKNTPFHIGSSTESISKGAQFELSNPVIQNALSGAGVWGSVSSNVEFSNFGISLRDVCRYPSDKAIVSKHLPYVLSTEKPTENNPIEIVIDLSNRPVVGSRNYFIQFNNNYVASDYVVSFDTTNTGEFDHDIVVTDNTNITEFYEYPQEGRVYTIYRVKFRFTKALQIANLKEFMTDDVFDYNPEGLIGICNIGMTVNDYTGRSFLGECGGSLYGNVDMHQNTLKNLPNPVDDGDAVSKAYLEARLENETVLPAYWQTELDNGVSAINSAVETAGRNKSAFLWYTDAHWGYGSAMSPKLLKHLHENTSLNRVNFGGDFCNDYEDPDTGKTAAEWVEVMRGYKRAIRNLPNHHSVIGNHDYNGVNGGIPYVADHLYGMSMAYEETPDIVRGGDFYYYIDEPNEKTRYLYLNTSFCTSLTGSGEAGQGQFVADALANVPEGWHIVPISHIWFLYADTSTPTVGDVPNYCKALLNLFDAYNNRGSGTITIGSESVSYNFADKGGWVEFCIGGHTHVDYDFTSDGGIPVILTATDSYHLRGSTLDPRYLGGTTDEASVSGIVADYDKHRIHVIRIGRGEGRVIDVANYESGYTNVLDTVGYTENKRLSASGGYTEIDNTGTDLSGYIQVAVGDTIYLKNVTMPDVSSGYSCLVYAFNLDKVGQASTSVPSTLAAANPVYEGGNLVQFTLTSAMMGGGNVTEGYIRVNADNIDSASIITINEPIGR